MKQNNDILDKIMECICKLMCLKEFIIFEGEVWEIVLICCYDVFIDKYLEKIGVGILKVYLRKIGIDCFVYYLGMGDGRNISLNWQIKGGGI